VSGLRGPVVSIQYNEHAQVVTPSHRLEGSLGSSSEGSILMKGPLPAWKVVQCSSSGIWRHSTINNDRNNRKRE
jgi:hypothetical protein